MDKIKEIKERLLPINDPSCGQTLGENESIKHIGIDENNIVLLIIEIGEKDNNTTKQITRDIAKVIKIDLGFSGVKIEFTKRKIHNKKAKTLLVASGKGGVGKSTVCANLAYALMRLGKKVAIIDADIYGANMPKIFGATKYELLGDEDGKIHPFEKDKIQMISTEYLVEEKRALMLRGPMLGKVLKLFFQDTLWDQEIDFFLVDLPPGTGDVMMDIKNYAEDAKMVIVTTPEASSAHIAIKAGYAAKDLNQEVVGVIENMSYYETKGEFHYIFGKDGGKKVAEELLVELLATIPITPPEQVIVPEKEMAGMIYLNLARKIINLL